MMHQPSRSQSQPIALSPGFSQFRQPQGQQLHTQQPAPFFAPQRSLSYNQHSVKHQNHRITSVHAARPLDPITPPSLATPRQHHQQTQLLHATQPYQPYVASPQQLAQQQLYALPGASSGTAMRPPMPMHPSGSITLGPTTVISTSALARMTLGGKIRPIFIAAGPPSIIKKPTRTKALLERPVPRIAIKQRTNTLLADFWSEDLDVTKDGKPFSISEKARRSAAGRRRTPKQTGVVVGIDFGNTCTGVSYAHQNDGEMIDIVKWPKNLNAYAKVPTVSLYKTEDKSLLDWGSSALVGYKRSKTGRVLIHNYKLQLFDQGARGQLDHGLHLTDVFTQYIRSIHTHLIEEVSRSQVLSAGSAPMHYCITVPQAWTLPTRELILRCYVEAGVIVQTPAPNVTVITEAEAAATYCREHCIEFESLKDGNIFMVCDAGGLTTHVTAFRVDDSLGVRQFVRLSSSHAEDCGSVMLDRKFKEFVLQRLEGLNIDVKPQRQKALETLLEAFVEMKSQFDANAKYEIKHISVPMGLDVSELSPAPSWMEDEYMSLSGHELCDLVFDPVIDKIQDLVLEQSKVHPACTVLFLVGGFGANKYLRHRLSLSAFGSGDGSNAVAKDRQIGKVVIVQKAELAVARGAVIYGLKSAAQRSKAFM